MHLASEIRISLKNAPYKGKVFMTEQANVCLTYSFGGKWLQVSLSNILFWDLENQAHSSDNNRIQFLDLKSFLAPSISIITSPK